MITVGFGNLVEKFAGANAPGMQERVLEHSVPALGASLGGPSLKNDLTF